MKRIVFLVLCLYFLSISGMAAQIHFCGEEFETVSFGFEESTKCCCESDSKCNNCCKNEQVKPVISNHFNAKVQTVNPITFIAIQVLTYPELIINQPLLKGDAISSLPFKEYSVPVFIKNCTYRL